MELFDTLECARRAGVARSSVYNWCRAGVLDPKYQVGDRILDQAEADRLHPGKLSHRLWNEADVERVRMLGHLTAGPYALTPKGAGRLIDDLAVRKTSTTGRAEPVVLLAPGLTVRRSVCTCSDDCDPFRAEVVAVQRDLRPAVVLLADARPVVTL